MTIKKSCLLVGRFFLRLKGVAAVARESVSLIFKADGYTFRGALLTWRYIDDYQEELSLGWEIFPPS